MINKTNEERRYDKNKKPKPFENSWSITYRKPNYDALGDPHASYYFLNKSMRKHLTSLRKSIDKQGSYAERKKIKKMIGQRIKDFDNDLDKRSTKVQAYYFKMKSSPSISSLESIRSRKSLLNQQRQQKKKPDSKSKQKPAKLVKNEEIVKQKSKTLQPAIQVKKTSRQNQIQLPKITNSKQSEKVLQANLTMKQEKNLLILNRTEHNKFLKFILERKKKLSISQNGKKQQSAAGQKLHSQVNQ